MMSSSRWSTDVTARDKDVFRLRRRLTNRGDPVTEIIARKIIELAQQGERDPVQLRERAIDFLSR